MKRFAIMAAAAACLALAGCSGGSTGAGGAGSSAEAKAYQNDLNTGFALLRDQRYAEAKTHFSGMAQMHPDDATVALALGVAHHELGEWDAAQVQYEKAIEKGNLVVVKETIHKGKVTQETTTVANLALANIEKLREDRAAG